MPTLAHSAAHLAQCARNKRHASRTMSDAPKPDHNTLAVNIRSKDALRSAYMPYIRNGGLFIPTQKTYRLGDEVILLIGFPDTNEKRPVPGSIVWITPQNAQNQRPQGIGIQFRDDGAARAQIEIRLPGAANDTRPTYTL